MRLVSASIASGTPLTIKEYESTALALPYDKTPAASSILTHKCLVFSEVGPIYLVVAGITRHKVERFFAKLTFPGHALVPLSGWKALGFLAGVAYHIAPVEATVLAGTDGSHAVLVVAHHLVALEAEEVVQVVGALRTLVTLKQLEGKLMAEHKKVCGAVRALREGSVWPSQRSLASRVVASYLGRHTGVHTQKTISWYGSFISMFGLPN